MDISQKPDILLIDSEPESRDSLQNFLKKEFNFSCTVLPSIEDYFALRQFKKYHLAFIDINFTDRRGTHLLKKIDFTRVDHKIVPLIFQPDSCSFSRLIQIGAYDFIVKPINFLKTKVKILKILREQRLFQQLIEKNARLENLAENILENHDELEARTAAINIEREILRSKLDGYKQLVENAADMIISIDAEGRIESVNNIMLELSGYTYEEMIGKNISCFVHPDYISSVQDALKSAVNTRVIKGVESVLTTKTDAVVLTEMNAVARFDYLGDFIGIWAILRDITEWKQLEEELKQLSIVDSLTKLYNKRYFVEILEKEIYRARRQKYPLSLIMIDLDKFKLHNDTHGHQAGDRALAKIGEMLRCQCRIGVDVPCRFGGDEFVIILPQVDKYLAFQIAERYQKAWEEERTGNIGLSIGITQYDGYSSFEEFIRGADEAMYQSKWAGGHKVSVF